MDFLNRIKHFDQSTYTKTMFLTEVEQAQIKNHLKQVDFILDGGYKQAERKRCFINLDASDITCFKINYNKQFLTLTHQNILGSLLALNIKLEAVGDILVEYNCFFVISELKEFIINEFTQIGTSPITLEEIDGSNLTKTISLEEHIAYIDSLRLDLVVSRLAKISRNDAVTMISNELIKVNHLPNTKPTTKIKEDDIISIRKKGRFMILDTKNTSKKNKIVLKYGKFI